MASPKTRLRKPSVLEDHVERILRRHEVKRYLKVRTFLLEDHRYEQSRRGRPGEAMTYRWITRRRWDIEWEEETAAIDSAWNRIVVPSRMKMLRQTKFLCSNIPFNSPLSLF